MSATDVTWVPHVRTGILHAVLPANRRRFDGTAVATLCSPRRGVRLEFFARGDGSRCETCASAAETECGTHAGYARHKKAGEDPCAECLAANAIYMREYRSSNEAVRERDRVYNIARHRALESLALEHPERFRELLADKVAEVSGQVVPALSPP